MVSVNIAGWSASLHRATLIDAASKKTRLGVVHATKRVTLPNGRQVSCINKDEATFLYQEIYGDKTYLQHGIEIKSGDTVVDVGANIGLFSLFAAEKVGVKGKVVAIEPMPPTYEALQANTLQDKHSVITTLQVGISATCGSSTFTYYPHATGWSTARPDETDVKESMLVFLVNALRTGQGLPNNAMARFGRLLARILPRILLRLICRLYILWMLSGQQSFKVLVTTVSDIIRSQRLEHIDLLKIDVERGEMSVVEGVQPEDWSKISQLVVECHDHDYNLQTLHTRLLSAGFKHVTMEQSRLLAGTSLNTIYARR